MGSGVGGVLAVRVGVRVLLLLDRLAGPDALEGRERAALVLDDPPCNGPCFIKDCDIVGWS